MTRFEFRRETSSHRSRVERWRPGLEPLEARNLPSFVTAALYPDNASGYLRNLAVADFNADGALDVVTAHESGWLGVLLNDGQGALIQQTGYQAAGFDARAITAGDFNGDGFPDFASASYGCCNGNSVGRVGVFLNRGDGTFLPYQAYGAGDKLTSITTADVTGDGHLDLVVTSDGSGKVNVLRGTGTGKFRRVGAFAAGTAPGAVTVGDFNSDAVPDLAVINTSSGTATVLLGAGGGSFTAVSYAAGTKPVALAVGDFNNDGNPDLVTANNTKPNGQVNFLFGNGDGTFGGPAARAVGLDPNHVLAADFDGDTILDLAVTDRDFGGGALHILHGNGDGSFAGPQSYLLTFPTKSVAAADFDNDGRLDLASPSLYTVVVVPGLPDGNFAAPRAVPPAGPVQSVTAMDLNADGRLDIATAEVCKNESCNPSIEVFLGLGGGSFASIASYALPFNPKMITSDDFNHDNKPDLAVAHGGVVSVLLGNGDGTFQAVLTYPGSGGSIQTGDFNSDGHRDLALGSSNTVVVLLGNGNGTFGAPASYSAGPAPAWVAVADLNDDAVDDIAAANNDNASTVSVLLATGTGGFQPAVSYNIGSQVRHVAAGDLNGDGAADLVVTHSSTQVAILLGNGDGTFEPAVSYAGAAPFSLVADFNGDGIQDVAGIGSTDLIGEAALFLGNGDGTLQPSQSYFAGAVTFSGAAGDYTGDGFADLVVTTGAGDPPYPANLGLLVNAADWPPLPIGHGPRLFTPLDVTEPLRPTTMNGQPLGSSATRPQDENTTAVAPRAKYGSRHVARVTLVANTDPSLDLFSSELT